MCNRRSNRSDTARSTVRVAAVISGPMPSPGRTRRCMGIVQYAFDHHCFSTKKRAARAMASPQIAGKCLELQSFCVIEDPCVNVDRMAAGQGTSVERSSVRRPMGDPGTALFHFVMIKPSHYDDEGYPIQWIRSAIPSNTLACLNALAEDARRREVL